MQAPSVPRSAAVVAGALTVLLTLAPGPLPDTGAGAFTPRLVTVDTPTDARREALTGLGLDLTEHAGRDYVEVVLHTPAQAERLRQRGFTWTVRIPDLNAHATGARAADRAYAAAVDRSPLPSGRTTYRTLEDHQRELATLASRHPRRARLIELPHRSLEGRPVLGLEVFHDVRAPRRGEPTFVMLGLHHAREWPSGELTMEFAHDLVTNPRSDPRIERAVRRTRSVIVPVVNPDGFKRSVDDGLVLDLTDHDDDLPPALVEADPTGATGLVDDGTAAVLATPNNAYKRKNCRLVDGQRPLAGECALAESPGGFGVGIDLNRNYGAFWGGPGASALPAHPTYHGAAPFSEPETANVRALVSSRHVTTLITNHAFSNLVLRPMGVAPDTIGPDGRPVGYAPDERAMRRLGAAMAAENGYTSQHSWQLYDTTGTTEDWSYNATGGYGYTFEIGPEEFHPPYRQVVAEYVGSTEAAGPGGGNREAFLLALANAGDGSAHAVIEGTAAPGARLRLTRTGATPTWEGSFTDTVDTTMRVGPRGVFEWHVNPSTRPLARSRQYRVLGGDPVRSASYADRPTPPPGGHVDHVFRLTRPADLLEVTLTWPLPDDLDLEVHRRRPGGGLTQVGGSGAPVGAKERVMVEDPAVGTYLLRVINYAAVPSTHTVTAEAFTSRLERTRGLIEAWTLTCATGGAVRQRVPVVVDRGERLRLDLTDCGDRSPGRR